MVEFVPLLRYFHSAYALYASFKCLAGTGEQFIFDSATSTLGNSPVFKADDGGVRGRTPTENNAENRRIYRAEAYCPLYIDASLS